MSFKHTCDRIYSHSKLCMIVPQSLYRNKMYIKFLNYVFDFQSTLEREKKIIYECVCIFVFCMHRQPNDTIVQLPLVEQMRGS